MFFLFDKEIIKAQPRKDIYLLCLELKIAHLNFRSMIRLQKKAKVFGIVTP